MHQKLEFDNPFWIQFTIQEMAFRLCTKQSAGGKTQEDEQLKFAPNSINLPSENKVLETPYFESINQLHLRY